MRIPSKRAGSAAVALVLAVAASALAVKTETWQNRGLKDFAEGELASVSVTAEGKVRLAPAHEELAKPPCLYIWALAEDSKGNLYLGTGSNGVVYKLDKDQKLSQFAATTEVNVHCLVVDAKDNLYAGTSPHGLIYRIAPDGSATIFFRTGAAYVWKMALDDKGNLFAATGKDGSILRIAPDGQMKTLYKTKETHVLCLAIDPQRGVFAGTSPSGLVYLVDFNGKASVLLDADEPEIHEVLADGRGRLFAVTASGASEAEPAGGRPEHTEAAPAAPSETPSTMPPREAGENSVYVITLESGRVLRGLGLKQTSLFAAVSYPQEGDPDGLYLGTGDQGRLMRVSAGMGLELLLDRPEKQILSLLRTRSGRLIAGTGNGATVLALSDASSVKGELISTPLDTKYGAKWGRLSWFGEQPEGTTLGFSTRSGNTATPDDTWSDWADVERVADSSLPVALPTLTGTGKIASGWARFLQYRVRLGASPSGRAEPARTPVVEEMKVTYQPTNVPPKIEDLKLGAGKPGEAPSPPAHAGREGGAETPRTPVMQVAWTANDPNGDTLRYDLYFKAADEKRWHVLAENLDQAPYAWNTVNVPDGTYRLLLRVSDSPSNPPGDAGSAEKVSELFVVDNTPPRVTELMARDTGKGTVEVRGKAADDTSNIARIELSFSPGKWLCVLPEDGILDARTEAFNFESKPLDPGEYFILARVTDEKDNVGVARVTVSLTSGKR